MENGNADYANVDAQLQALIAGCIEAMGGELDYHDHLKSAIANLKAHREDLWRLFLEHKEDTRRFAHALLTHQTPPVALISHEPSEDPNLSPPLNSVRPPAPNPHSLQQTKRIAEMLAPPTVHGRPNRLAQRVQQG